MTHDPRELGQPYSLDVNFAGGPTVRCELRVGDVRLRATPTVAEALGAAPFVILEELTIGLDEIRRVVARASRVDVVFVQGGVSHVAEFRPTYADRQRLLWELAVRVPDAVERGIEEMSRTRGAAASPPATNPSAVLAPTSPRRDGPVTEFPHADTALSGLDEAMTGLGSSLVAAAARNPPPPRSGLGCGLFVTGPRDEHPPDGPPRDA